jgi:hypothetical protein
LCSAAIKLNAKGNVGPAEQIVLEIAVVQIVRDFLKKIPLNASIDSSMEVCSDNVTSSKGLVAPDYDLSQVELPDSIKGNDVNELLHNELERLLFVAGFTHFISEN